MQTAPNEPSYSLSEADREELNKLVIFLELSDSTTTIFAIAPESGPQHPVVEELKSLLSESEEGFQFQNFFYSDNSLHNFLYALDEVDRQSDAVRSPQPPLKRGAIEERGAIEGEGNRLVVMAFGIDQLPTPRLVREMKQLNLGRDSLFKRKLVLIFWLNKVEFLDEFRHRAPDFWDWRGKVVQFEARPVFNPLFYPYLEWLIAENSYLKISGVMQVQRQVDIFLDQIYVSLQAVRRQQVTETSERGHRELEMMTSRHVGKGRRGGSALDEFELLDEFEPLVPDFVPTAVSTKTVTQKVDLSQAVRENQYCVILGVPGAGKTTLLRYLALHFATAKRDGMEFVAGGEGQEDLGKPLLPIFFRIADYAERLAQEPDLSLLEYLRQFYRQWEVYFETSSSPHTQGDIRPPTPPIVGGTGVQSSPEARPQDTAFCPPSPPILGGTGVQNSSNLGETGVQSPPVSPELRETEIQSPPELGDLGGEIGGNAHPDLPPQLPLLRGELELEGGGDADIPQLLCEQMRHGQCLMLLDGLDEVFDQESRRLIVERINQFVEVFSANKFVVTSRIAGYRDVKLSERFAEFTIEDMGSEQVEGFLHRWCRAVERAQQPDASQEQWQRVGDEQTREILAAIQANEGVKRLTANPLLLTILALIHRNGSRLPHRRVELYALAVKTLTEDWQLGKKLPDAPKVVLKESEVVELLAPLAYWMHEEKPSGVVSQAEAEERLAAILAELNDDEPESESVRQAVEQFLRKVRETTGLFVERAPGVYGFMHLTFEEYFAARYIADHERSEILELIRKHLHEPRWNEPILLALGYYGVHSPRQVNKLVEELFSNLEVYEPAIQGGEIRIKNASSPDAVIVWSELQDESENVDNPSELRLKDLLFAGEVLTQVEVNSRIRSRIIEKLVRTLVLDTASHGDTTEGIEKIIRLLRQIEVFNQKSEVIDQLKQLANDPGISDLGRAIAQLVILYVACSEAGSILVNCATDIINQLNPLLFRGLKGMVTECGEEMTPALESTLQVQLIDRPSQQAVTFLTALSYIRTDCYGQGIALLEQLNEQPDNNISHFIAWALATCYQAQANYEKAIEYYGQSWDRLATYPQQNTLFYLWDEWGICYRLHAKYEQSLDCFQKSLAIAQELNRPEHEASALYEMSSSYQAWGKYEQALECQLQELAIRQKLDDQPAIALAYWRLGRIYQDSGKYEEALANYQQSRELHEQLGQEKDVAELWYWLSDCYRDWGRYEQALECEYKELGLCQRLNDQSDVALAYWRLGRIYQDWGKYEEAPANYQQSRDLYEQLGQQKDVAELWYWLSDCYRDWGKYEQALECQLYELAIRQKLDDQSNVALAYWRLGRIYQNWGKYEEAIAHHQQSRDLYRQLGQEESVANQWKWLSNCYQAWGKYEQALECELQELAIRQKLDDQSDVALAYWRLGRIYQAWNKYEQAIAHHQQSRDLYRQLGQEESVANQWKWLSDCYQAWGKYEQALECELQELAIRQKLDDEPAIALAYWRLGYIYQDWGKYEEAIAYYQQSRNLYEKLGKEKNVANLWDWISNCYRDWGKYEQALECRQQHLRLHQSLENQSDVATAYYHLGRIYQDWGKYEEAIAHYQQSLDLYEQFSREKNVASQWYNLADCYKDWGNYERAVECQQQCLRIRQTLDDQSRVALSYYQLGRIYLAWGKYEQAIANYQQSRNLYEQLGQDKDVASRWYNLADCYRDWGKHQQALECQQKCLRIRQTLDDQSLLAVTYYQLGRIYQAWGKYEQAIAHYQQSRELYEQLGKQKDVANQWNHLADCYCDWGKYEKAIESQQQCLTIRQTLDNQSLIAVTYHQLCQIYQAWGKYEQAITQCQRSLDLYEELGREKDLTIQLFYMAICYLARGKYEQALEYQQRSLLLSQKQEDQLWIALNYSLSSVIHKTWGKYEQAIIHCQQSSELYEQLGRAQNLAHNWSWLADCYCDWGKYEEAIAHHQQSCNLYEQLDLQKNVANQWNNLANCYRDLKDYTKAVEYYQQSRDLHQQLGQDESVARCCRQIGNTQGLLAKNTPDIAESSNLLTQAEQNIRQAIQLDTAGDYKGNLAYDYTTLGLLWSERLRLLPSDDPSLPEQIAQFEDYYNTGLTYLTELGRTVKRADKTLDMARAYLEINALENLDHAQALAQESLQIFQDYNRRKLEAAAHKLLGEIYLKRAQRNQPHTETTAHQFLSESLQLYRELDLTEKATEVEQLMQANSGNAEQT